MKPLLCIAEPYDSETALDMRVVFPKEFIIINGIQFTAHDNPGGLNLKEFAEKYGVSDPILYPYRWVAFIDRDLFPIDTTIQLPHWMMKP